MTGEASLAVKFSARMKKLLRPLLAFLLPLLVSSALYGYTMAPDVYVSDFAEFQYLPAKLGVPHPNGFPLFVLVGWAWSHLPWGTLAWRMNLLAVLTGALAVGATSALAYLMQKRLSQALITGLLLAITPTLWKYSVAAERYGLNLSLICGAIGCAWLASRSPRLRWIALSAGLFSLALTTHPTSAVLAPIWLLYLVSGAVLLRQSWRAWGALAIGGVLPLLLYLYVPWRWAAFLNSPLAPGIGVPQMVYRGLVPAGYQNQLAVDQIWAYLSFGAGMVGRGQAEFSERLSTSIGQWGTTEFAWWIVPLVLVGMVAAWRRERRLAAALVATVVLFVLTVATTAEAKVDAYLLPATWAILLAAGFGGDALYARAQRVDPQWRRRSAKALLIFGFVWLCIGQLIHLWPTHNQSRYLENRRDWETLLAHPLDEAGALLADWSDLTPFWYMQQAEQRRPALLALFPPQPERVIRPWVETGNPLYLAAPLAHGYAPNLAADYALTPWGKTVLIQPKEGAAFACPASLDQPVETPPAWPYQIDGWAAHFQEGVAGRVVRLFFCWSAPAGVEKNEFLTLDLVDPAGAVAASISQPLVTSWYPGRTGPALTGGVAVVPLYLEVGVAAGDYQLRLTSFQTNEEYRWQGGNAAPLDLGIVSVTPGTFDRALLGAEFAPPVAPRAEGLALRAWLVSDEVVRPGDPLEVELIWQASEAASGENLPDVRFQFWDRTGVRATTAPTPLRTAPDGLWRTRHTLNAPVALGDAAYWVELQLVSGERVHGWGLLPKLWLGRVNVQDRAHRYNLPGDIQPIGATFADSAQQPVATLSGYKTLSCNSEEIALALYWQAHATADRSYRVFVHLIDENNQLLAQHDGVPGSGDLPTTVWVEGEIIEDIHVLTLPAEPSRDARLLIGLYTEETGRLVAGKAAEILWACDG